MDLIRHYFHSSYTYAEICGVLALIHGISISVRTLKRRLRVMGLRRQTPSNSTLKKFAYVLKHEVRGTGRNLGYRSMAQLILQKYRLRIPRYMVLEGQRTIDPEGVAMRKRHKLIRRLYRNPGPNFCVHTDGYDKVKPYGFPIHGAIDGFSRRVLWLRVAHTNNNPDVVAYYFVQYLRDIKGIPRCVQMDAGTENITIQDIQKAFHMQYSDRDNTMPSTITTSSPHNQRIERFWRNLSQMFTAALVEQFKDLVEIGLFTKSDPLHVQCLRFCCMDVVQEKLDEVTVQWNQHNVRQTKHAVSQPGKPDLMFYTPTIYGASDYKIPVMEEDITAVGDCVSAPVEKGCSPEFVRMCSDLMRLHDKRGPQSIEEAIELFVWLATNLK